MAMIASSAVIRAGVHATRRVTAPRCRLARGETGEAAIPVPGCASPSFRATACDATFSGLMLWMTDPTPGGRTPIDQFTDRFARYLPEQTEPGGTGRGSDAAPIQSGDGAWTPCNQPKRLPVRAVSFEPEPRWKQGPSPPRANRSD